MYDLIWKWKFYFIMGVYIQIMVVINRKYIDGKFINSIFVCFLYNK